MYIALTSTQTRDDPWRDPDVWVNDETGAFATEEMAMADGGSWHGFWRIDRFGADGTT